MTRRIVGLVAVLLAFCLASASLADPPKKKTPKKRTVTGTIVKVNAKRHSVVVKPVTSQQVQTQSNVQQKKKSRADRPLVIHVDEKTKITVRTPKQQAAKGQPATEQTDSKFGLLHTGQLVRVVCQRETVETPKKKKKTKPDQKQKTKPDQKQEEKLKPDQKQKEKEKAKPEQEQKEKADPVQKQQEKADPDQKAQPQKRQGKKGSTDREQAKKPKRILRALSIEVLGQSVQQQEGTEEEG